MTSPKVPSHRIVSVRLPGDQAGAIDYVASRLGVDRSTILRDAVTNHLDALVAGAAGADPRTGRVDDRAAHDAVRDRAANQPGGPTHTPTRVPRRDPGAPPRVG